MRPEADPAWYLFDYGMVISTAPDPSDWAALGRAVGADVEAPTSEYWTNRLSFDAGELDPAGYWSRVAGRPVDEDLVEECERLDGVLWSHLDPATLRVLDRLRADGARLALLSNMPAGMSWRYAGEAWTAYFAHTFFSGRLGLVKPDPRVFRLVLAEIGAEPEQVVFVDDSPANVAAAQDLGLRAVRHTPKTDLAEELGLR